MLVRDEPFTFRIRHRFRRCRLGIYFDDPVTSVTRDIEVEPVAEKVLVKGGTLLVFDFTRRAQVRTKRIGRAGPGARLTRIRE
jgi:hypothetical protein